MNAKYQFRYFAHIDVLMQSNSNYVFGKLTNSVAQEPEGSSPHSQQPATGPYPEPA
jgi:hypothetical protein